MAVAGPAASSPVAARPASAAPSAPARSSAARPAAPATGLRIGAPAWAKLTPQQQAVLAPLKTEWPAIDAVRRRKWLDIASQYPGLPPDEQQRIAARMAEWTHLSPDERARARLSFQEAKQLSPQERQAKWEAYKALPPIERRALQARAAPTIEHATLPAAAAPRHPNPYERRKHKARVEAVAPTNVQVRPGATTTLMNRPPVRPLAVHPGGPPIVATPGAVDPLTLLPRTGPQAPRSSASAPRAGAR